MNIHFQSKNILNAKVCNFPYGKKAGFVEVSDYNIYPNEYLMFFLAMKNNIRLTTFINYWEAGNAVMGYNEGICDYDIYYSTDRWRNPTTGALELIPDYYATAWTSAGKAAFPSVTVGATKVTRYPNHGQEMYDISSGALGWNFTTGVPGTSQGWEMRSIVIYLRDWYKNQFGKNPRTFSYRNGQKGGSYMFMPYFIGGRNSDLLQTNLTENCKTSFGKNNGINLGYPQTNFSRYDFINNQCSIRTKDMGTTGNIIYMGTPTQVNSYTSSQISNTIANGGNITNFIHRTQYNSDYTGRENFDTYLGVVNSTGGNNIWRWSYGEMCQYLIMREMAEVVSSQVYKDKIIIAVKKVDKWKDTLTKGISEKLIFDLFSDAFVSVEIDLTGTFLEGKNIKSNGGTIYSLGSNKYTLQISFGNLTEGTAGIEISESTTQNYVDLTMPTISNVVKSGTILTFDTDIPCVSVLGYFASTSDIYHLEGVLGFSSTIGSNLIYKTRHSFNIGSITNYTTKKFVVGAISKQKQSSIINNI